MKSPRRPEFSSQPQSCLALWDAPLRESARSFMGFQFAAKQFHHIFLGFESRKRGIKVIAERLTAGGRSFQPSRISLTKNQGKKPSIKLCLDTLD